MQGAGPCTAQRPDRPNLLPWIPPGGPHGRCGGFLGLGEGGEQNAPLGRAVIGGLLFATVATLVLVPLLFCMVHGRPKASPSLNPGVRHA